MQTTRVHIGAIVSPTNSLGGSLLSKQCRKCKRSCWFNFPLRPRSVCLAVVVQGAQAVNKERKILSISDWVLWQVCYCCCCCCCFLSISRPGKWAEQQQPKLERGIGRNFYEIIRSSRKIVCGMESAPDIILHGLEEVRKEYWNSASVRFGDLRKTRDYASSTHTAVRDPTMDGCGVDKESVVVILRTRG